MILNPGYPRAYGPVVRTPSLFRHHTNLSTPTYNPTQPRAAQLYTKFYSPHPTSPYRPQSQYTVQAPLPYNPNLYPYYSATPQAMVPSLVPFSSYYPPSTSYSSTVSSKGLSIILTATLILVALDLMIVRPQKR